MGFYQSKQWLRLAKVVRLKYRGVCQSCGNAGKHVHHIIPITELNKNDPSVTLNIDNLILLCKACHSEIHQNSACVGKEYMFDKQGVLVKRPPHSIGE